MDADGLYNYEIEDYINFEGWAEDRMQEEDGRFLESGYVCYHGGSDVQELFRGHNAPEQGMTMGGM
jgi:hypothetical protein